MQAHESHTNQTEDTITTTLRTITTGDHVRFNDRKRPLEVVRSQDGETYTQLVGSRGGDYTLTVDEDGDAHVINHPPGDGQRQSNPLRHLEIVDTDNLSEDVDAAVEMAYLIATLDPGDEVQVRTKTRDVSFTVKPRDLRADGVVAGGVAVAWHPESLRVLPRLYRRLYDPQTDSYRGLGESQGPVQELQVTVDDGTVFTVTVD